MNEKDKAKLKELQSALLKDGKLNDTDAAEYAVLKEKAETGEAIKQAMAEYLKDVPALKNLHNLQQKVNDGQPNGVESFATMLKGISRNDQEMIKSASPMTEGTSADGGYLVPALTEATILEQIPTFGQGRKYMTVMPMTGNVINIPKESTLPTWSWVDEAATIASSKPTLDRYQLTPKKGAAIVVMSNELLRDANVNIAQYVIKKITQVRGTAEDIQFFKGTGSPFTGVFTIGNTYGNTVTASGDGTTITYQNLLDMVNGVDPNYLQGASVFMHRTTLSAIEGLKDSNNRPLFVPSFGDRPATLMGYPVVIIENAPVATSTASKPVILLGNLESSIIGDIMGMDVRFLTEATIDGTNLAQYDLSAVRVISRVAFTSGYTPKYSIIRVSA